MRSVKTGLTLLLIAGLIAGCAAVDYTKSLFVAGVSLEAVGRQFAQVSAQVKEGCDVTRVIPQSTCLKYREFGTRFKQVYPVTVGLWKAADSAGDKAAKSKAEDVAISLAADLSALAIEALGTLAPEVK